LSEGKRKMKRLTMPDKKEASGISLSGNKCENPD
jgi:hypothetical protein